MILRIAIALLAVASAVTSSAEELNILFLGNSFTARHDIAGLVEQILEEGDPTADVQVQRVIYGGQNMFKHSTYYFSQSYIEQSTLTEETITQRIATMKGFLKSDTPPNPEEWNQHWSSLGQTDVSFAAIHSHITRAIKNHEALLRNNPKTKWDYVVLQSWRDVSEQPNQAYERYATKLAEIVRAQGAEVILYMTSPETQNQDPVTEPYKVASAERDTAVGLRMAKALQPKAVIPVPLAIKNLQTGGAGQPGTELVFRYHNDGHPNQTCAFLVANLFYAAITGKSPECLAFNSVTETKLKEGKDPDGGEPTVVFGNEEKAYLQRMAYESVLEFNRGSANEKKRKSGEINAEPHVYEVVEVTFSADNTYANPYLDVDLWVDLTGPGGTYKIPAFWDGGNTFRVRLVATAPGEWRWSTSNQTGDSGLDNKSGTFDTIAWTAAEIEENPNRRGFIRVASNQRTLEYADGTPFFHTGDTWWTALTHIFAWGSDEGVAGISFQDAIAKRKSQGFNGISMIACFPSDTLNPIWESGKLTRKVAEDGSTPFLVDTEQAWKSAPDYTRINPSYWQHADRKMKHMWDQGFVAQLESVRRHEEWYNENQEEKDAFTNYIRYMWARWGCYNVIFNWVHADANNKQHLMYQPMVVKAEAELGKPPYGQPRSVMTPRSNLEKGWLDLEPSIVEIHSWSNYGRDGECITGLREMFTMEDFAPLINLEPFYPGLVADFNRRPANMNDSEAGQFIAYGCVLNGGALAGHVWGDAYYGGCAPASNRIKGDIPPQDPQSKAFDKFNSASMGKLKDFILDPGHNYRLLEPAIDHLANPNGELLSLALAPDKSLGLGFICANKDSCDITMLTPDADYRIEWWHIDDGGWQNETIRKTNHSGRLSMPDVPGSIKRGWAFRILRVRNK